ncbi:DsbA family oxidoreductase [Paenibacillus eucommiae]|uniref:DsbA family dithiol-disulfide isomerase n=1 Tax=Paenibacillus eucommiae TaxID=1355755 RepID=A0ABS4ISV4_9BACL|nr:DsbA family oxidoreductase [Paenibacillus eucommiae]MBP1990657.1 putative DsbA family dithiol-disulfide isomerase [Paenibacillus eucommiae]
MKVEIWSDFLCPFCYIGKRRFEAALEQFAHRDKVEVVFRSFELDPNADRDLKEDVHSMLSAKYGMSREQAKAANDDLTKQAAAVGLTYHFDTMILTNSFDAHRLTHWAATHSKRSEMTERLLKAYFTDSKHIGDHETLAALAAEVGLDQAEAAAVLASSQFTNEVRSDEEEGSRLGIRGVPFFVINRKYGISGAQPSQVFMETMQKAWDEDNTLTMVDNSAGSEGADAPNCEGGACDVPSN